MLPNTFRVRLWNYNLFPGPTIPPLGFVVLTRSNMYFAMDFSPPPNVESNQEAADGG